MKNIKARPYLLGLLIAVLFLPACNSGANQSQPVVTTTDNGTSTAPPATEVEQRGNALLRVVHALPGVAATDVFAGDTKLLTNISYKAVTPYKEVPTERQMIRLRLAGQDTAQPLAENSERFTAGGSYTVIAQSDDDSSSAADLRFVDDDLVQPTSGKARVRVIHTSYDVGNIDVYAGGRSEALFSNVGFSSTPTYSEVDPMSGALEVRLAGKNIAALTVPNARFEAGKIYTIIVVGRAKGTSKIEAMMIEDRFGGAATSGATQ